MDEFSGTINALASVKYKIDSLKGRLYIFWLALKNVFTGKGLHLSTKIEIDISDEGGLSVSYWRKAPDDENFKQHTVTYDGVNSPKRYIDGELIN